jgi:signal transduction histidine kinase
MRRQGPLTLRHLLVSGLVMMLVMAQLTWWVLFTIRESRARLNLEHTRLTTLCGLLADRVNRCVRAAETELLAEALTRETEKRPSSVWQNHFAEVRQLPGTDCDSGWRFQESTTVLRITAGSACFEGVLLPIDAWLNLPPEITISSEYSDLPRVELPEPFSGRFLQPSAASWEASLDRHHRRLRMFLSEGGFFSVMMVVLVALLWKTVRRDIELEHQHRNFISAITHELKSPLAAMQLALETVLRGRAEGPDRLRFLRNALKDTERLQSMVQKVLEVTRYGRRAAELNLSPFSLSELVDSVSRTFSRRATAAEARLDVDIESGIQIMGDKEALPIVVSNLLENAIKYGGANPVVSLTLSLANGRAILRVSDNGIGISADDLPFVFDRFVRGGNEMTRTTQGTGLGLYLVRQIVSGHGGSVEVESTGPQGTTFQVIFPEAKLTEEGL